MWVMIVQKWEMDFQPPQRNEIVVDIIKVSIKRKDSRILAQMTFRLFATSFKLFAAHSHHDKQFATHKVIMANCSWTKVSSWWNARNPIRWCQERLWAEWQDTGPKKASSFAIKSRQGMKKGLIFEHSLFFPFFSFWFVLWWRRLTLHFLQ